MAPARLRTLASEPRQGKRRNPILRLRQSLLFLAAAGAVLALGCGEAAPVVTRVVYAGDAGTPHAESFHALLSEHFEVQSIALADLASTDLSDTDVLVIDGEVIDTSEERSKTIAAPNDITLETLDLPTVLIGGKGAQISDNLNLKLGWRYG